MVEIHINQGVNMDEGEINATIAEFLGWTYHHQPDPFYPYWKEPDGTIHHVKECDGHNFCLPFCWSIDSLLPALRRLHSSKGKIFPIRINPFTSIDGQWTAVLGDDGVQGGIKMGENPAHALAHVIASRIKGE